MAYQAPAPSSRLSDKGLLAACALAVAMSAYGVWSARSTAATRVVTPEAFAVVTHDQRQAMQKLTIDLSAVSQRLDQLGATSHRTRTSDDTRALRLQIEKLENGLERNRQDIAAAVAPLVGRFEQLDRHQRELSQRLAEALHRIEELERQRGDLTPTGSIQRFR